jgi:hypothetical protein
MVNVNGGHISDINIYSSGGIKMIKGKSFSGVSASHKQNCTARNRQTGKGKSGRGLPFFFLNMVWLLQGFRGYLIVCLLSDQVNKLSKY